jgi:hypothetical protein
MSRRWKLLIAGALALAIIAALFTPEMDAALAAPAGQRPFVWGQDDVWAELEETSTTVTDCDAEAENIAAHLAGVDRAIVVLREERHRHSDPIFGELERSMFEAAARIAACPSHLPELVERTRALRNAVKNQSIYWDLRDRGARDVLYRLLYGSRAALEEVILQAPRRNLENTMGGIDEPSRAPSVTIQGVELHSGDILLSRGGAPTSALISRGNDYPGNFSHVALLHVSEDGAPTVIESHIERGVVTSTVEEYLEDTKLRIAVLRVRANHSAMLRDPMIPHRAAERALNGVRAGHVPYDFRMDWRDPSGQFCSEVAYAAYLPEGIRLWRGLSSMSSEGLTRWLGAFGVRNFVTLGPSDLEYDPQVRVVAEWRNPDTLFADHMDNAVSDVLLESAERGANVEYSYPLLPIARVMKGYSVVLNSFGRVGPVPEGMSATTALRAEWLRERHRQVLAGLRTRVRAYRREHGRRPPYWTLVALAREAERAP